MIPLQIPSQRVFIIAGLAVAAVSFISFFSYNTNALSLSGKASTNSNSATVSGSSHTVYLSPQVSAAAVDSTQEQPMLEVHIANNGLMLLRGARVLSISGSTIHVGMSWGSSDFTWAVETNYNTTFLTSKGEKEALGNVGVGDTVTVTGQLSESGTEPTIDADVVRE